MKLILSRKGFDSDFGGCASPIFEDDSFVSLPLPHWWACPPELPPGASGRVNFSDIGPGQRMAELVEHLSSKLKRPLKRCDMVHLDPDLSVKSLERKTGWVPLFGQADAAQKHLEQQQVGPGDIFLFFGWFRKVEEVMGRFRFKRASPNRHIFFGWLRVGEIWRLSKDRLTRPAWASLHPHVAQDYGTTNTVYVAAKTEGRYDAGTFRSVVDELVLTVPKQSKRSYWRLPKWFFPSAGKTPLSYHSKLSRWTLDENHAYLQSVGRGQEFVLDAEQYPQAEAWAKQLIAQNAAPRKYRIVRPNAKGDCPAKRCGRERSPSGGHS
jgi:hypothetical protein